MGFGDGGRSSSIFTSCHRQCDCRPRCALCPSLACLVPIGRSLPRAHRSRPGSYRRPCRLPGGRLSMMGRRASTLSFQAGRSGLHRPSISVRPGWPHKARWLRPASSAFVAGLMPLAATLQGGALPGRLFGCGQGGHLFPPAISRGRFQPPSPPFGSAAPRPPGSCRRDVQRARHEPQEVEHRRNQHRWANRLRAPSHA